MKKVGILYIIGNGRIYLSYKNENVDKINILILLKEHETGFEPAAPTLARWCSTPEPLVHIYLM